MQQKSVQINMCFVFLLEKNPSKKHNALQGVGRKDVTVTNGLGGALIGWPKGFLEMIVYLYIYSMYLFIYTLFLCVFRVLSTYMYYAKYMYRYIMYDS